MKTDKEILDWLSSRLQVDIRQHYDPYIRMEGNREIHGHAANISGRVDIFTLESQWIHDAPSLRDAVTQAMEMKPICTWKAQP